MIKERIKVGDITDKAAQRYFIKRAKKNRTYKKLSAEEKLKKIKKIKQNSIIYASIMGALGVLLLYIPQYFFTDFFSPDKYPVPFTDINIEFSMIEIIYGFILVGIEIFFLIVGDLRSVSKVAAVYGYEYEEESDSIEDETTELVYISIGKQEKKFKEVGINPFQNFSKAGVALLRIVFLMKAFLSNFVMRIVLRKVLGRAAIRSVVDLAGIPIYAFWNAYASSVILRKAHMRMLARELIYDTVGRYDKFKDNKDFKKLLYDALGYIAITKKNYHPSDYVFAKHFLNGFDIKIEKEHNVSDDFLEKLRNSSEELCLAIGQILVIGFLLDGRIGTLEIREMKQLQDEKIIDFQIDDVKSWTKDYLQGNGFDRMFDYPKEI